MAKPCRRSPRRRRHERSVRSGREAASNKWREVLCAGDLTGDCAAWRSHAAQFTPRRGKANCARVRLAAHARKICLPLLFTKKFNKSQPFSRVLRNILWRHERNARSGREAASNKWREVLCAVHPAEGGTSATHGAGEGLQATNGAKSVHPSSRQGKLRARPPCGARA